MDPDQALRNVIQGLADGDDQAAMEAFNNYTQWVGSGGFQADSSLLGEVDKATNSWADRLDTARTGRQVEIETQSSRDPRGGAR